jgi:hypothetical protein
MIILPIQSANSAPTAYTVNICTIRLKMFVFSLVYSNAAVCGFCEVRWIIIIIIIIIIICFSLLLSNYSTYFFATFFLCFVFLFFVFVFYFVYPVFLYCFSFVYSCLFPIFVQVYRPLPLGGNPMQ